MSNLHRLAETIAGIDRLAKGHATTPQFPATSLDNTSIPVRGPNGEIIGSIGVGEDGGLGLDHREGPKPPKPGLPVVTADGGILRIEWDGSFENTGDSTVLATSDCDRVEIHASQDENFVPDRVVSFGGAFGSMDGGSFALGPLPDPGTWYVRLVARSKAGKFSEPSERAEQELAIAGVDLAINDAWLKGDAAQTTADGKNKIRRGPDKPINDPDDPFTDGDIWFEMVDGKSIPNIWDETVGDWVGNDDLRQSQIEAAQQALREDLDAIVTEDSGRKNFYQPNEPLPTDASPPAEDDLWYDTDDHDKPHIYQGTSWLPLSQYVSEGELAPGAVTETVIADDAISAPKIQTNAIETDHLDSKIITTDKLAVGAITAESGIIGSINAATIIFGEMSGARIKAGTIDADTVLVESSIGSTLIKDGAILTEHIKVGAITAESGIIGSLDANVITVGKIMGNQLDADAINGKTITGAIIRTASVGSRVELTHNGLKQYNSLGQVVTDMSLGRLSLIGDIATGFAGERRVEIKQDLWDAGAGIVFVPQSGADQLDLEKEARIGSPFEGAIEIATQSLPNSVEHYIKADESAGMRLRAQELDSNGDWSGPTGFLEFTQSVSSADQRGILLGMGDLDVTEGVTYMSTYITMGASDSAGHWSGVAPSGMKISASGGLEVDASNGLTLDSSAGISLKGTYGGSLTADSNFRLTGPLLEFVGDGDDAFGQAFMFDFETAGSDYSVAFAKTDTPGSNVYNNTAWLGSPESFGSDEFGLLTAYTVDLVLAASDSSSNPGARLALKANGDITLDSGTSNTELSASSQELEIRSGNGVDLRFVQASTGPRLRSTTVRNVNYSGGSNMRMDKNGSFCVDGSSARYKDDIQPARNMPSVLDVEPRTWMDKLDLEGLVALDEFRSEVGEGPAPQVLAAEEEPPRYFGAVAEEVDDLGLTELVRYDAFGRPDSLEYEKFGVALIPIVRELRDRIDSLEAQLAT